METYWLQSAINDKMIEEVDSSDDDNAVVSGLLVTDL